MESLPCIAEGEKKAKSKLLILLDLLKKSSPEDFFNSEKILLLDLAINIFF
jgi:hypothetical protein